jgi:hypothetical protein
VQAIQSPFLAVQALLQGPGASAATEVNKDVEKGESGAHDAGESAPGPETGSEAERGSVEGPDEAGAGELGGVENVNGADVEVETNTLNDGAPTPSAQAQTVHGKEFGGVDKESLEKPVEETDAPDNSEKAEGGEASTYPPNLQFPKWEVPAFLLLFVGMPNRLRSFVLCMFRESHFDYFFGLQLWSGGGCCSVLWRLWRSVCFCGLTCSATCVYCFRRLCCCCKRWSVGDDGVAAKFCEGGAIQIADCMGRQPSGAEECCCSSCGSCVVSGLLGSQT